MTPEIAALMKRLESNSKLALLVTKVFGSMDFVRTMQQRTIMRLMDLRLGEIMLDAGCGSGFFAKKMSESGECIGVDLRISDRMFSESRELLSLSFVRADVLRLPFADKTFDRILASSVVQMLENDMMFILECKRTLKNSGSLVLTVPIGYRFVMELNAHKQEFNTMFRSKGNGYYRPEDIANLLANAGFKVVEREYSPNKIGSSIYELWLSFCYHLGLPLSHPAYIVFLYPFALADRLCKSETTGNELVLKAVFNV